MGWYLRKDSWSFIFQRYLPRLALFSLAWEILQLPFYTLASETRITWIAYAIAHCTVGDILIGTMALIVALVICRSGEPARWPGNKILFWTVLICAAYTIMSERHHLLHGHWAYSPLMPIIAGLQVGLSPLLQWLFVPAVSWWLARSGERFS